MALADLPGDFVTFGRDEIIDRYKRDYALRNPEADVVSGQPDLDARLAADLVMPVYYDARLIADGINEDAATGPRQDVVGNRIGRKRGAAKGATGYVTNSASAGGGTIQAGDELENPQTKKKYEAAETKHVNDGEPIRVRAKSTGPDTDVAAGTVLRWTSPRPGIGPNATVAPQGDGVGLTGGAEAENDERYREGIRAVKQNPPAGDNDAELVDVLRKTPDVPVEQVFTYPAAKGPGSTFWTFTVLTSRLGASRIPTAAQVQAALEWLIAQMPAHGSYFPMVPTSSGLYLAFAVTWATGGWTDATQWPPAYVNGVAISSATGPLNMIVTATAAPVVGQSFGVWDRTNFTFRRKRILTVTGSNPYTLVCDTSNGASDTTYTPQAGQKLSPWSDNLVAAAVPVLKYMATLGPGELFSDPDGSFAEGRRRHRSPEPPKLWPNTTSSKVLVDLASIQEIATVDTKFGIPTTPTPALPPNMLELSDLAFFPS